MFVCAECGASQPGPGHCTSDGKPLAAVGEDLLLGTTIGAYRVARLLGIGGMGRVYAGVHPTIGSRVAIKVLSRECSDRRDLVERFFSEAKAVNLIRHESIVNVLDLAMLPDGRPYIIMEYLDGAPLAALVDSIPHRGPLPLGGLARLAVEVLDALGAAHAKGIVHRDLKPDNIFVTPAGRPKVLDFGIAKLSDMGTGSSSTRTGSLLGTPHYMSPEQAAGRPVDHRADIYAIGIILFECATGHKPFQAESLFDLLRQHVEAPPPSPRTYRGDMPVELEHVILCALAKQPEQRFASAHAMSMALQHATQQLPSDAWMPLTAAGPTTNPGGWAPTPPASWGGSPRATATSGPREANKIGNQSTVSASSGQVHVPKPTGSKKGLWIALAAVVVVGGGVTAAVVAGGGASPSNPVASKEQGSDIVEDTPPAPAPSPAPSPDPAPVRPDPHDVTEAMEMLDEVLKDQPPEIKKQLEGIKDLGKLSPAQRAKKLAELNKKLSQDLTKGLDEAFAVEDPDTTGAAAAKTAWITEHDLAMPNYNPKRVDVGAVIKLGLAEARKSVPDAELSRIDANGVSPDGFANLELPTLASDHGSIDLRFFSPSRSKRDPKLPVGVPQKNWSCEFRVEVEPDGIRMRPINGLKCDDKPVPAPKCSAAAVWKKATAKKAPANAVGNLGYRANFSGKPTWYFDVGFGHDVVFSTMFGDDC